VNLISFSASTRNKVRCHFHFGITISHANCKDGDLVAKVFALMKIIFIKFACICVLGGVENLLI
jgi:hypothetical protein